MKKDAAAHIYPDSEALSGAAARRWLELAVQAIEARGAFHVALSGGSTPRALFQQLARPDHANAVDWDRVHVYFGDERLVPADHADSNFRMANETLLSRVPLPTANIHRVPTEAGDAHECAARYADTLRRCLPTTQEAIDMPCFDLVLLGIGPDGHTASLFPSSAILEERAVAVAAVYVEKLASWRVSLTFPVLNSARHIMVLVAGADKAPIVHRIFTAADQGALLPIEMIEPQGQMEWFLDQAAARQLQPEANP